MGGDFSLQLAPLRSWAGTASRRGTQESSPHKSHSNALLRSTSLLSSVHEQEHSVPGVSTAASAAEFFGALNCGLNHRRYHVLSLLLSLFFIHIYIYIYICVYIYMYICIFMFSPSKDLFTRSLHQVSGSFRFGMSRGFRASEVRVRFRV